MLWCTQCVRDILSVNNIDVMWKFIDIPITFTNKVATVPQNIIRILSLYTDKEYPKTTAVSYRALYGSSSTETSVVYTGDNMILPSDMDYTTLYLTYYGTPVDEDTGDILIPRVFDLAVEAYCTYNMYLEDIMLGKLNNNAIQILINDKNNEMGAAMYKKFTLMTVDQITREIEYHGDLLPQIGNYPL